MGGEMTDLAAIRARVAAATPGPWEADDAVWGWVMAINPPKGIAYDIESPANAALIAHAPTDLLALCAEVERVRTEVVAAERRGAERALRALALEFGMKDCDDLVVAVLKELYPESP